MNNLTDYDVLLVNSSAGKDSQATLHYVCTLAKSLNILDRVVVVHADLGRVEWKNTKELAAEHAAHYGVRFEIVKRNQGDLLDHIEERGMFPSSNARYCTSDHKRGQVARVITKLNKEISDSRPAMNRKVKVLNIMGIRAAESKARAKKVAFSHDKRNSNKKRHVDLWYPIFEWSVQQVWECIKEAGTRHHYAYDLGMPRLSCAFCVFAPKPALMIAGKHNPELLDEYVKVEKKIGHTFTQKLSLTDVQNALAEGEEVGQVSTWEM